MTGKAGQDGDSPTPQGGTAWSPAQPAGSVSSASGILSLAFTPALASMKEQECEGHKAMFVSALRLSGTHGLTPKVHYAPGNRGSVYTQSCASSLELRPAGHRYGKEKPLSLT